MTVNAEPPGEPLAARDDPVQLRPDDPAGGAVRLAVPARGAERGRRRRARPVRALARASAWRPRRRRSPSTTWPASTRPRTSWSRSSTSCSNPDKLPQARRAHPARRAAVRARPAPARRCWPAPWPARPACRSSPPSASEFIEAIVGVGASRVRDLFKQAKEAAPAIIFIDELDAIGRARGGGGLASAATTSASRRSTRSSPRWTASTPAIGVIVLGATNRPDVLDPALLRPGRFDRRVAVQPPDGAGRELILRVHTRSVPLADDVDLERLAPTTPGMVGADLANLVNEAALLAARRGHEQGAARRLHRRAREDRARRRAQDRAERGGPPPDRLPRGRARDRRDAHARAPTRCARCRSSRAGRRSA